MVRDASCRCLGFMELGSPDLLVVRYLACLEVSVKKSSPTYASRQSIRPKEVGNLTGTVWVCSMKACLYQSARGWSKRAH